MISKHLSRTSWYYRPISRILLHCHGFSIVDAQLNDVNGGSIRALFGVARLPVLATRIIRRGRNGCQLRESEAELIDWTPIGSLPSGFNESTASFDFIKTKLSGKENLVYGALIKGNTMLQYFGLDHSLITAAAERNPDKWAWSP
jgi:hypothetical protein